MAEAKRVYLGKSFARSLDATWRICQVDIEQAREGFHTAAVYRLRKCLRKLEANLCISRVLLGGKKTKRASKCVQKALSSLGHLRDAQIQAALHRELAKDQSVSKPLLKLLAKAEHKARKKARTAIGLFQIDMFVRKTAERLAALPRGRNSNRLYLKRVLKKIISLKCEAIACLKLARSEIAMFHRARIDLKRFLYLAKTLGPVHRVLPALEIRQLCRDIDSMGKIHDLDLLLAQLSRWSRRGDIKEKEMRLIRARAAHRRKAQINRFFGASRVICVRASLSHACLEPSDN